MKKFWSRTSSQSSSDSAHGSSPTMEEPIMDSASPSSDGEFANEQDMKERVLLHLGSNLARIPFATQLLSAYYCALDKNTPNRVRMLIFGALAYFVMPVDVIPDFLAVVGFTDDASVLLTAFMAIRQHIQPRHTEAAENLLEKLKKK